MRRFSFATGLRCEGCHVVGENGSFQGARFHLDDKLTKRQARYMLKMVNRLNSEILPGLPERDTPALRVECKTCHRGIRKPYLLRTELRAVIETDGVEAAVACYGELREGAMDEGIYDFGVWEMNELARQLEADGGRGGGLSKGARAEPRRPAITRTDPGPDRRVRRGARRRRGPAGSAVPGRPDAGDERFGRPEGRRSGSGTGIRPGNGAGRPSPGGVRAARHRLPREAFYPRSLR